MRRRHVADRELRALRRVFQADEDGCGITCVAMLAGISYGEARDTIFGETEADATSYADLRSALLVHGVTLPRRLIPFWEGWYTLIGQPALLAINPMSTGMWHWAVWDAAQRRILDPLRRPPRAPVVVGYGPATRLQRRARGASRNASDWPEALTAVER